MIIIIVLVPASLITGGLEPFGLATRFFFFFTIYFCTIYTSAILAVKITKKKNTKKLSITTRFQQHRTSTDDINNDRPRII